MGGGSLGGKKVTPGHKILTSSAERSRSIFVFLLLQFLDSATDVVADAPAARTRLRQVMGEDEWTDEAATSETQGKHVGITPASTPDLEDP